jgi:DNA-binding NarL/FixJ family response regulator
VQAVCEARERGLYTSEQLRRIQRFQREVGEPLGALGEREREVLRLVVRGRANQEIAEDLVLSVNTVEKHVSNLLHKLGVRSRVGLVAFVLEHRLDVLAAAGEGQESAGDEWWVPVLPAAVSGC